jgi:L-rhamnose mutarotase
MEILPHPMRLMYSDIGIIREDKHLIRHRVFMTRLEPGAEEEYKRRHDEIWPEMLDLLRAAGIRNYTIWSDGLDVFGYYECEKGIEFAEKTQAGSPVVDRWNEYMADVLDLVMDPETGAQPKLKLMFRME